MSVIDWVRGDMLGLEFPAHSNALRARGTTFLTAAFRAAGAISGDNSVTRITQFKEIEGGSTGRKLLLSVQYQKPAPHLHTDLFVKFSRDFDDARRDPAKVQMELEVRFALLSRSPDFPITVPVCYCADYHHESGTGILITQRIPFGRQGIERQYPKCLDHQMPDQLGHYRAIIQSLGRLAGAHKAGQLSAGIERYFPFDPGKLSVSKRAPQTPEQTRHQVARYVEFATAYPRLLPANVRSSEFLARFTDEAPRFQALESVAKTVLQSKPELVAFCHWNAHVDNAWFWRDNSGRVACGLMDWGNVSQMNVSMALWGALSGSETAMWNNHLDELLYLFISEYADRGGPALDISDLKLHLVLYVGVMGLAWMLDAPALIESNVPQLAQITDPLDERFLSSERARSQLLIMTNFLNLWEMEDMARVIAFLESRH